MYINFDTILSLLFIHSGMLLELDLFESTETIILAITGIFSLLLLGLSISAYLKTRLNKILFAAAAFALFGIQLLIESLEENIEFLDTQFVSIITSAVTLGILVLFFFAIVKKSS
jgi:hypothetical protein